MDEENEMIEEEDIVYGVIVTELVLKLLRKIARDVRFNTEHILEIQEFMSKFSDYQGKVDESLKSILEAVSAQGSNVKGLLDAALSGDIPGIDAAIEDLNKSRANILDAIAGMVSTVESPTVATELPAPTPEVPLPELVLPEPVREVPTNIPDVVVTPTAEGVGVEGGIALG